MDQDRLLMQQEILSKQLNQEQQLKALQKKRQASLKR